MNPSTIVIIVITLFVVIINLDITIDESRIVCQVSVELFFCFVSFSISYTNCVLSLLSIIIVHNNILYYSMRS